MRFARNLMVFILLLLTFNFIEVFAQQKEVSDQLGKVPTQPKTIFVQQKGVSSQQKPVYVPQGEVSTKQANAAFLPVNPPTFEIFAPMAVTTTSCTIAWNSPHGGDANSAHHYQVFIKHNGSNIPGFPQDFFANQVNLVGLTPGNQYSYEVYANVPFTDPNDGISKAWIVMGTPLDGVGAFTTDTGIPNAPVATAASPVTQSSFVANWNSSAFATKYFLDVATDINFNNKLAGFNNLDVGNITTISLAGLPLGTLYYYRVRAFNNFGTSGNSNTITTQTLPSVAVSAAAGLVGATSCYANWGATAGASGYYIDVATDNLFTSMVAGYTNKDVGNVTTYQITGLSPLTTYYYRVRAYNLGGSSASSATITLATLPAPPVAVAATSIATNSFVANWNSVNGIIGYKLQVDTNPAFPAPFYDLSVGTNLTYTISTGVQPGVVYYYRVASFTNTMTSEWSNTITQTTLPNTPVALSPSSITPTSFKANWNAATGAAGYYLDVATDAAFTSMVAGYTSKDVANVTNFTVTGLTPWTTYYYRVISYSIGQATVSPSSNSIISTTVPVTTAATLVTQSTFNANWNVSAVAIGYYLDVATDNLFTSMVVGYNNRDVKNVTTHTVSGLNPITTYYYRVRAYTALNASPNSNVITTKTLLTTPVATPATALSQTSFYLNWNASPSATGYNIDVATDIMFTKFVTGYTNKDVGNVTAFYLGGLNPGTPYFYRVRGYYAGGTSENSNVISVLTIPLAPISPVADAATLIKQTSFTLNWVAIGGVVGYYIDVATDNTFTTLLASYNNKEVGNVTSYTVSGLTASTTYYYRVRAYNTGGVGANSNIISVITMPVIPGSAIAASPTFIKQTSFTLNWVALQGATGYYVDVATDSMFTTLVLDWDKKDVGNVISATVSGITASTKYYYRVRGYNESGTGGNSNTISVTTLQVLSNAPVSAASSQIKQTSFTFSWNEIAGAQGYNIDVATDSTFTTFVSGYNNKDVGNVTSATVSGLTANTKYYYRVRGYNLGGVSPNSNVNSVATLPLAPNVPATSTASLIKQTSFTFSWNAIAGATGYDVDVATDSTFTTFVSGYNNKDVGNVTSVTVSGLTANTKYYYRVRGYNPGGIGANSNLNSVVTLPLAPTVPVAIAPTLVKQTSFTINWNAIAGATGYDVDVATDSAFTTFVSGYNNKDVGNVTSVTVTGLTANTKYFYRIRGYNLGGIGSNSNVNSVVTLPVVPNAPVATAATIIKQTSFNLNWNTLSGATGYSIDVATDNAFSSLVAGYSNKDVGNVTTYAASGLTAGATYYYRVRGYNLGGPSANSNIISAITLPLAPNTPVAVAPTLITQTSVTINWNAIPGANGYDIDVSTDSTFSTYLSGYNNKDVGNVTSITLTGLTSNTKYFYRVRGYNTGGTGVNSNTNNFTTLQIISNAPVARPASSVTQVSFVANWNLVPGVIGYCIDVATDNTFSSILTAYNNKDVGNVASIQVTNLMVGTAYYYRVRTYNTGGQSANSIIIPVSTIPIEPPAPVAIPGNVTSVTSFTANWNAAPNATGYYLDVAKDLLFTSYVTGYSFKDVGNVLTYTINGLTAGTTYYFRVVGYNASGIGQYSNVIMFSLKTTGIAQMVGIPTEFKLNQNYPNPFNPSTKIRFEIPSDSYVRLKLYNAVGQEVKELANEEKSAGIYEVNFKANDLPSGIYIFRFEAKSNNKVYSETRKMILMK